MEQNENDPLSYQVGGSHYSKYKYQPIQFFNDMKLDFNRANAIKYLTRWKDKGGVEDLRKAVQYLRFAEQAEDKRDDKIFRFLKQFEEPERRLIKNILYDCMMVAREELEEIIEIEEANIEAEEGDNESNSDN